MPAQDLQGLLAALSGRQTLTAADALAARQVIYAGVEVTPDEADGLVRLNAETEDAALEWRQMFVEAMTDYLVNQQHPQGWVDEPKAQWLIGALTADGAVARATELEAVVHILERADRAPLALADFAMAKAKDVLTSTAAPLTGEDVELMRRVVFAPAGAGSIAVSRAEAEVLFDVNDAVRGRANDPAWADFFARAVGNCILAATDRFHESRAEALRQEAWLNDRPTGFGLLSNAAKALFHPADIAAAWRQPSGEDLERDWNDHQAAERATSERVTSDEAAWLRERVGRDGQFDEAEQALIRFLSQHAPSVDSSLQDMVNRTAQPDAA